MCNKPIRIQLIGNISCKDAMDFIKYHRRSFKEFKRIIPFDDMLVVDV